MKSKSLIITSLIISLFLLFLKGCALSLTQSKAVLADFLESSVHLLIVGFATFSLFFSQKPADRSHPYGHDRIAFFSAGFEGAMIFIASFVILYQVCTSYDIPSHLEAAIWLISFAFLINGSFGLYLISRSKKEVSLILESNGKHLLTDCITNGSVIFALLFPTLDSLVALLVALNILWMGVKLLRKAVHGLMDRADPKIDHKIREILQKESQSYGIEFHQLRHRMSGNRLQLDVHLLFPQSFTLFKAHLIATEIERKIRDSFVQSVDFVSHLEPKEDHDHFHKEILGYIHK